MSDKPKYEKTYINGSARKIDGTDMVVLSLDKETLLQAPQSEAKNGKTYIKFIVAEKREIDSYGNTHNVFFSIPEGESSGGRSAGSSTEDDW